MKNLISYIVLFLSIGLAVGCNKTHTSDKSLNEQGKYHINVSDTSTIKKEHKSVLVISGSPRKGGNTDLLCDEFIRGAEEVGGRVEKIFLSDYQIEFFSEDDEHRFGDKMNEATDDVPMIVNKMVDADIIVLSSPVYYMNITGQLKTLIDRTFGRYMEMKDKEFFYITACADAEDSTAEYAIDGMRGFVMCLPNPTERGMVKAIGMGRKSAVKDSQFMQQAYKLGKKI